MLRSAAGVARYLPIPPTTGSAPPPSGRDVLSQLIFGARSALEVGLTAAFAWWRSARCSGCWRAISAAGRRVIIRLSDIVLGLPFLPALLVLAALTQPARDA